MIREYTKPAPIMDILEEHVEESAFMYESRLRSFVDPELSWKDLLDYEQRMLPHLHALALGGFDSAKFLKDKLTLDEDEEPGETFVASYVYTTLKLIEPMQWLIEVLIQQPPHFKAIVDGLKFSKSKELEGWLEYFIGFENPIIRTVGAEVIGYRGLYSLKDKLMQLQSDSDPYVSIAANYSLSIMGVMPDKYKLKTYLDEDNPSVVLKAIELLLRLGDSDILEICREKCALSELEIVRKLIFYLAIAGNLNDVEIINDLIQRQPTIKKECLLALGMIGHAGSLNLLVNHLDNLDDWDSYTAAFQGLRFITGMDFIPQFDPDEAEHEEVTKYKNLWEERLDKNRNNFSEGFKWRRGEKLSPEVLYKDLNWIGNPCREFSYLEMVLRYGLVHNFQYDQFYDVQVRQFHNINQWIQQENNKYQPGAYYFHKNKLA